MRWKLIRRVPGIYTCGDWDISRSEVEIPGYEWLAEHPNQGEHYFRTLAEAKRFVLARVQAEG